jgi:hypothetical protein
MVIPRMFQSGACIFFGVACGMGKLEETPIFFDQLDVLHFEENEVFDQQVVSCDTHVDEEKIATSTKTLKKSKVLVIDESLYTTKIESSLFYLCSISGCKYSVMDKYTLGQHIAAYHGSTKICPYSSCNKEFKRFYSLLRHILRHLDCRPYVCDVCNAAFVAKTDLDAHKKTKRHSSGRQSKKSDVLLGAKKRKI